MNSKFLPKSLLLNLAEKNMLPSVFHRIGINKAYRKLTPLIKNKKTSSYLSLILSLFSISFFGFFAIRPTLITAVTLNKSVADLKKLDIEYENKISNIITAQSQYEQIRGDIPGIDLALPKDAAFNQLANALEKFSEQSNLLIKQLQIDRSPISRLPPSGKVENIQFSILTSGSYISSSAFIQHLLNWKRLITLDNLELSKEGGTESAEIRMTLKGKTYYEP